MAPRSTMSYRVRLSLAIFRSKGARWERLMAHFRQLYGNRATVHQ